MDYMTLKAEKPFDLRRKDQSKGGKGHAETD